MLDEDLPELSLLILRPTATRIKSSSTNGTALRRSPRKQKTDGALRSQDMLEDMHQTAISSQQRISPRKSAAVKRPAVEGKTKRNIVQDAPQLGPASQKASFKSTAQSLPLLDDESDDTLADVLGPISTLSLRNKAEESWSDKENSAPRSKSRSKQPTSAMSRITQVARQNTRIASAAASRSKVILKKSNPYVLKEAHCEDLNESSGTDGEDEDTDLSGFIVDDNAELSFHNSSEDLSSESEVEKKRRNKPQPPRQKHPRRLVRGRKDKVSESDDENDQGLSKALNGMNLGERTLEKQKNAERKKTLEIIDLTSSPVQQIQSLREDTTDDPDEEHQESKQTLLDPFSSLDLSIKLQPSSRTLPQLIPSKIGPLPTSPKRPAKTQDEQYCPCTPPATPPRSPSKTKLNSPTKLFSPSKRGTEAPRSPHRQSMDAFWDHNIVNEWNDTYSPKKAPTLSPRKNPLARFNLYASDSFSDSSDLDCSQPTTATNSSQDAFDESSDSLPSPSESPSKSRSPSKLSALKAEQARIREEKRMKLAAKKSFDAEKEGMALDLLLALDKIITDSKITAMAASTGGIKVIWSKTLRSTAGRANWKRTVTKPSGSPIKGDPSSQSIERQPGVLVQHFASIELAEKIIDRPERLVNTLAHEFCHLANFMVSGIRDQPHGESFKRWGTKVTSWLRSSAAKKTNGWRAEWKLAEVTTKHSYVVETKYLWVCVGRPADRQKQTLAMKMLNMENEDEESCGAEYGRHSKSIDVEKQRCGRCKGFLVQVRPTPRAPPSPKKGSSPAKRGGLRTVKEESSGVESLESMLEVIDLSD